MNLTRTFFLLAAWAGLSLAAAGQAPIPEPDSPVTSDLPVMLSASDPLTSLEEEVAAGEFDRRAHLAAAFDEVNSFVDTRLSTLQARGLQLVDEAEANLASARDAARTAFRDLALSTEETWRTARHNAVMALRKVRGALEDVERTSALPR